MEELKVIDQNLTRITKELDSMWRDIAEHVKSDEGNSVADLGSAINLINDIRERVYKIEPSLKSRSPKKAKKSPIGT